MARPLTAAEPRSGRYGDELSIAIEAARNAGRLQMERYERLERIVHKSEHDVVTEVDEMSGVVDHLRNPQGLRGRCVPGRGIGRTVPIPPSGDSEVDSSEQRKWIIDPLDGTVNYANGIPVFCVSIGLAIGGQPVFGVI